MFEIPATGGHALPRLKDALHALCERELEQLRQGVPLEELFRVRTGLVDALITATWADTGLHDAHASLVAVGGYGRGELFPHSDIDILVLLSKDAPTTVASQVESFISQLWDAGLHLGHSTRTPEECLTLAASDLSIMTSLLEARLLTGSSRLWHAVIVPLFTPASDIWPPQAFFRGKQAEQQARHHRFDDSAYKIEPNIKESPGGLRDWHTLRWLSCRIFHHDATPQLVTEGLLTDLEQTALLERIEFLSRLRFTLHLLTERHEDRLLLIHQKALAAMYSEAPVPGSLADEPDTRNQHVEAFMQRYFRAVLGLERINQLVMQQFEERLFPPEGEPVALNPRFNLRGKLIETAHAQVFLRTPSAMLEIFLLLQQHHEPLHIRASTLRQLQSHVPLMRAEMRHNPNARALFIEILRQPRGVFDALKQMNRLGLLAAYLPDFENIVGRMQFDLFHLYTVDAHTLLVIRNLRRFSTPLGQTESPLAHKLFNRFDKPELLILAALFHDIAKGMGGQHEILGAEKAKRFCKLHNLPQEDIELVEWLVREHLHLSFVAQRRDLDDSQVIEDFSRWVGTQRQLDALYLLTVADIHATNPTLWSDWRAALLRDLYTKTRNALKKGHEIIDVQSRRAEALTELAKTCALKDETHWHKARALLDSFPGRYLRRHQASDLAWRVCGILHSTEPGWLALREDQTRQVSELFIYTHDQPQLFSTIAATLDRLNLSIQSAYLTSSDQGMVVDDILFLDADGHPLRDAWMQTDLLHQLHIAMTQGTTAPRPLRRASPLLRHFDCPTHIDMETSEHGGNTRVQIETVDRPGLLALISGVLAELGMNLQGATINTLGEKAHDTLYVSVREPQNGTLIPLNDEQKQQLEQHLSSALRNTD
jgi:[protein-PII] uridylyltransferase